MTPLPDQPSTIEPDANGPRSRLRIIVVGVIVVSILVGYFWVRRTPLGRRFGEGRRAIAADVRDLAMHRPAEAAGVFFLIYLLLAVSALPVWPWQSIGGVAFGLWYGSALCLAASVTGAVAAAELSRWAAADYFHRRVESRMEKLRQLDHMMGHNGLLVVMTSRLIHFLPFGLSNYAFGLLEISIADIFVGTLLGAIPATVFYVGIGAGYHPRENWKFDSILTATNLLLLIPLALRYTKPEWFKKWGLE